MYLLISALCVLYYIYLKVVYGGLAFSGSFLVIALVLAVYQFTKNKIKENKKVYKVLKTVMLVGIIIFIIMESLIVLYPKHDYKEQSDYMIILGTAVKHNTPSLTLRGRLDTAIEYINRTNDDLYIVVSGGKGSGENISEALAMKTYLIENRVSEDKIIMEDKSTNTYENFMYSREKIEDHSGKSIKDLNIKVVTTDFHAYRSSILAKRNGFGKVTFYTSNSLLQFKPVYYLRECFALSKSILLDR